MPTGQEQRSAGAGGATQQDEIPVLPKLAPSEREQLHRRQLGASQTKVSNRFQCVRLAAMHPEWTTGMLAENLGIPEHACVAYLRAYIADGLDGLGREPPGGETFYTG